MTMNGTSVLTLDAMRAKRQRQMAIAFMLMAALVMLMLVVAMKPALATGTFEEIGNEINKQTKSLFGVLQNICGGIALVCFGFAVVSALIGGEKGMDTLRKRAISIGICFGLVFLIPLLLSWIRDLFYTMGQDELDGLFKAPTN